jgi:hypothetical protein
MSSPVSKVTVLLSRDLEVINLCVYQGSLIFLWREFFNFRETDPLIRQNFLFFPEYIRQEGFIFTYKIQCYIQLNFMLIWC